MTICVIGMGKIGLPLAVHYAEKNNSVIGVDINEKTVTSINSGEVPFPGENHLDEKLKNVVKLGRLISTTDFSFAIPKAEIILVIVPLFVSAEGEPDFRAIDSVTTEIGTFIKVGTQVIYETTLPIGSTKNRFTKMLETLSGMKEGIGFYVTFSPERVLTGRVFEDLGKYPKIVGGVSPISGAKASEFYLKNIDFIQRDDLAKPNGVWEVENSEAAELVKLAETTYRDVNIGLANQFARFAFKSGIDIYEVISAANSQTFSHIHQPGISVGGHCIPIYPRLYLWKDPEATLVSEARKVNLEMPDYAIGLIKQRISSLKDVSVAVLGITYRTGVKETAFSGAFPLIEILMQNGAKVYSDDPMYTAEEISEKNLKVLTDKSDIEVLILHTNHANYDKEFYEEFENLKIILDGRNSIPQSWIKNEVTLIKLGDGTQKPST